MTFQIVRAAGLAAVLLAGVTFPAFADDPVVAVVNGKEIHRSVVEEAHKISQFRQVKLPEVYPQVLEFVVTGQLLLEQANKLKLGDDPLIKAQIRAAQSSVLQQAYLKKKVEAELTDDVLRKQYEEIKSHEQVHARHILVDKEDDAKQIIKDLKGGAKFEDIAKAKSKDPSGKDNGGDLDFFSEGDMVPEFSAAAFKLKKGEIAENPVQTSFGWHVIQVLDRRFPQLPPFEEIKPRLQQEMGQQMIQKVISELVHASDIKAFDLNGKPLPAQPAGAPAPTGAAPAEGGGIAVKP